MVVFFTWTLGISIIGLLTLLVLKQWELSTGHVLGGRIRPAIGAVAHHVLSWFEYVLPGLLKENIRRGYYAVSSFFHRLTALTVLFTERGLEKVLGTLKHKTQIRRTDTEASAFLREVSAHKKQLLKRVKKRVIYEE